MDEGRKRVLGIMATTILASLHMQNAGPQGSPRSDKLILASIQWAADHAEGRRMWREDGKSEQKR